MACLYFLRPDGSFVPAVESGKAERQAIKDRALVSFTKLSCVPLVASGKAERALKGKTWIFYMSPLGKI